MQREIALSPCTCGINFPAVYIGKEYLYEYSEQRLELVFLHELYHIRHCDAPTKLLTLLVTSIFSFLPGASQIRNTVSEDAEFRCDEAVLKAMGENSCGEYISVILDIAERTVRNPYQGYDYLSGISRTGDLILRRYHAMKNPNKSKAFFPLMLVLTASLALNMFLFSVVSVENMDNMGIDLASPLLEDALCSYFSVSDSKELTEKDISSIYSIEFALSEHNDKVKKMKESGYAIRCILNEGFALDTAAPQKMSRADQDIVPDHIPDSDIDMYLRNAYESGELWIHLAETKTADTRDIVLFGHLRTLIFSDRIASSCEEVYTSDKYAVISRNN